MTFAAPMWLWALLAVPLIAVLEFWATRRDQERTARLVARALWGRVVRRQRSLWRFVRLGSLLVGTAGLVLALAGPQWGIVREKVEREGVDVVLALDASGSMATDDVQPSRFFLARAALMSLVERLEGDRFALVAFESEAYPLVPLTLDADAIGLFLDTLEPGIVPAPGTSLGVGLARGLDMFVDAGRNNKVMVLVSDGEDLEGEIESAVTKAKQAGVVVYTVGVGTEKGAPVPEFDADGNRTGFKKNEDGSVVISRLNRANLQSIASATGGEYVEVPAGDTSLWQLAAAIDGIEQKTLAREYSYRRKERFQLPLAVSLLAFTVALLLPLPSWRRRRTSATAKTPVVRAVALTFAALLAASGSHAEEGRLTDEVLLRPSRFTSQGRGAYADGDHPKALERFEKAAGVRPADARTAFNLADGLYKAGKYEEAATIYRALGANPSSELAAPSRHNLGNALYQQRDYPGAVRAYRDALALRRGDPDTRRNLELALRAIEEQKQQEQQQKQQNQQNPQQNSQEQQKGQQRKDQQQQQERPKSEEEKEQERFQREVGMPKERAMQLLEALQQNEKDEQRKLLALQRAGKKKGKDW